mmetsp:Transcript_9312/g.26169  ORF Transcript_9312/g.26169 Transcript_9312/m.26169 type:complete len:200 (-) Transcript_9312:704-1303(-)
MSAAAADHAVAGDFVTMFRPTVSTRRKVPMNSPNSLETNAGSDSTRLSLRWRENSSSPFLPPRSRSLRCCNSLTGKLEMSTVSVPRLLSFRNVFAFMTSSVSTLSAEPSSSKVKRLSLVQTGFRLLLIVDVLDSTGPTRAVTYGSERPPKAPVSLFIKLRAARICTFRHWAPPRPRKSPTSLNLQTWKQSTASPAPSSS